MPKPLEFNAAELELLRIDAERVRAFWKAAGVYPRNVYEEKRYEIVREYARGADPCSGEKQQAWLLRIKKELKHLSHAEARSPRRKENAAPAEHTISRGA